MVRHLPSFFCSRHVYLTYTQVGTGETYFAAFAALNLLVNLETFLDAACLEIVPFAAACISFFSARCSFSAATSRLPSAIAASNAFKTALRWFLILLFLAVFLSITLILFFADLMFAIIFYPTILNILASPACCGDAACGHKFAI